MMRILLVNKFLRPVGGTESVLFTEWRLLENAGHSIIPFGVDHPDNVPSPYRRYWLPESDYQRPTLRQGLNILWSHEAAQRVEELVSTERPDIVHLHNIYHQISPSILPVLAHARIPMVMTVHDYKLVCPNYRLFTGGAPCTRCVGSHPWHALRNRCIRESWSASALIALETALHRRMKAYSLVDHFLAPSRFVQSLLTRSGIPANKISTLPHVTLSPPVLSQPNGTSFMPIEKPFILFAGRMEPEKGLHVLMEAARRLPDIPFVLAGSGSLDTQLRQESRLLTNVTLLGRVKADQLMKLRESARAELMPVIWYEAFGMSALEAMQSGLPVIASNIGGLPEVVRHEETGLLVTPGDATELVQAISRLWADEQLARDLGSTGRVYVRANHKPEQHLATLLEVYQGLLAALQPSAEPVIGP